MTIKGSGSLALTEIQAEFGGSAPVSLSEYYRGGGYTTSLPSRNNSISTSGAIAIGQFFGTMKYSSGSASWYSPTSTSWTAPPWVETVYVSGTAGGAGGGALWDEGCIHDCAKAGGGSSGQMCSNYAVGVSGSNTYSVWVGGGGGSGGGGQGSGFAGLGLSGGNPGGSRGACSYFYNCDATGGGTIGTGGGIYGYNGQGGYEYSSVAYYNYGGVYYNRALHGGAGGAGWGGYGGGGGADNGGWGGSASQYGGGGGGSCAWGLNGGGSVGGGSGHSGFISITW